ncbi:hypothetical protein ASF41_22000 [Methylobacterium sp. Leaf111]|nr:hypothetical protein ASF41_22000 [Methylobacterium sp. Leaf111]
MLSTSRHFSDWLATQRTSLAFTTYQAGKLFLIGLRPDGRLGVFERSFARCMGLAVSQDSRSLLLATRNQIVRFDTVLAPGETADGRDALYAPHACWITGDLDAHDIGFGVGGRPVFANTLFSCLAAVSDGHSFRPLWRPSFVSRLAPEDRCHLNGMALKDGVPTHVTVVAPSDVSDGWREGRAGAGQLISVETGEAVLSGLSMPHSPRWHDGRLWLLNSGRGELGYWDEVGGRFEAVAFCPGYARGLSFLGPYALVGLSLARENRTFQGLPLDAALASRGAQARCGLLVIDTRSGDTVEWLRIEGVVRELFDVAALPGVVHPGLIGLKGEEINRVLSIEPG